MLPRPKPYLTWSFEDLSQSAVGDIADRSKSRKRKTQGNKEGETFKRKGGEEVRNKGTLGDKVRELRLEKLDKPEEKKDDEVQGRKERKEK